VKFPDYQIPVNDDVQRLFHGRGHAWPGWEHIQIDWYAQVVVVMSFEPVEAEWLDALAQHLKAHIPACECILFQQRQRQETSHRWLLGEPCPDPVIEESGLRYQARLGRNQNTGFFPDMVNGRRWVQQHAAGKRVLNLFSYTCSFSVAAIAGGAERVVNMDMSKGALATGRDNHRLNQQSLDQVRFEAMNIFRSFGRLRRHGPFDLLVCDPPSFQKGSVNIQQDYRKILKRIPEFMAPGSDLLLCLNHPSLGADFLYQEVSEHCPDAHFVERIANPEILREATDTAGLKVLRFRYCPQP